ARDVDARRRQAPRVLGRELAVEDEQRVGADDADRLVDAGARRAAREAGGGEERAGGGGPGGPGPPATGTARPAPARWPRAPPPADRLLDPGGPGDGLLHRFPTVPRSPTRAAHAGNESAGTAAAAPADFTESPIELCRSDAEHEREAVGERVPLGGAGVEL